MAARFDSMEAAIAHADKMHAVSKEHYCVTLFRDSYRVILRATATNAGKDTLYSTSKGRTPMAVADTEENRKVVESYPMAKAARMLGVSLKQVEYARKRYGWALGPRRGVSITEQELREAMKKMSALEFARLKGVNSGRIYNMCARYCIDRPHRRRPGARPLARSARQMVM